jgi:hypothetical protein
MPFLPYIPFPNCVEVDFIGILQAQLYILTAGGLFPTTIAESDMDTLFDKLDTWFHDEFQPLITATLAISTIRITDLTTAVSLTKEYPVTGTHDGTQAGSAVPNNVAMSVTLKTAKRGRSYRGRNYIGGLPAAALTNPTFWNPTIIAATEAIWVALGQAFSDAGFTHVVLSRQENSTRRTVGVPTPIQQYIPRSPVATMRRRVAGRGA